MEPVQLSDYIWKIPKHGKMNVPVVIYASGTLIKGIKKDITLSQAMNVASLNGILQNVYVMPDAHQGYGFPIGGVAAFSMDEGIISPGGVGYDINCGVRLLATGYFEADVKKALKEILVEMFSMVPAGMGKKGKTRLTKNVLTKICLKGAKWAVENGYGTADDLARTEENGEMKGADFTFVSQRAVERGLPQLGTLGSGNHFLEIQKVVKIYDEPRAKIFGIKSLGQIMVMIHCGSRGLGHQIASDYIKLMKKESGTRGLSDVELINAPIKSALGRQYYGAMGAAVNFAFANRQMIAHQVRRAFKKVLGDFETINQVYDVCHNVAKFEEHEINGEQKTVCVHRKGATRSFGPGRMEISEIYREVGQPVIIPGSMGTASYLLSGTTDAEQLSFGSTGHGAGRIMSRNEALRRFKGDKVMRDLKKMGIELMGTALKNVAEEAPGAYKDVDDVVFVSHNSGMANLVAKLAPLGVIKG